MASAHLHRIVGALARAGLAVGLLVGVGVGVATPASATTFSVVTSVTGNDLTIGSTVFALGSSCGSDSVGYEVDTGWGTIDPRNVSWKVPVNAGGTHYVAYAQMIPYSAVGLHGAGTVTSVQVAIHLSFLAATSPGSCSHQAVQLCHLAFIVELDGTYTGTRVAIGNTYDLSGPDVTGGAQPDPTCNAGPTFLVGQAVNLDMEAVVI